MYYSNTGSIFKWLLYRSHTEQQRQLNSQLRSLAETLSETLL